MKDIDEQPSGGDWRPGRNRVQVPLTGRMAEFLADATGAVVRSWEVADDTQEFLMELSKLGWEESHTKWASPGRAAQEFDNRYLSTGTTESEQLRVTVSVSSRNQVSLNFQTWWRTR
jgi:hypothetical protein